VKQTVNSIQLKMRAYQKLLYSHVSIVNKLCDAEIVQGSVQVTLRMSRRLLYRFNILDGSKGAKKKVLIFNALYEGRYTFL
jgi:uncharacterized membrane protein